MAKRAKAPKGFYTASDVMRILGIGNSTLYHYANTGKIKKVVPPDRSEGYYVKAEVDKMAHAKELFLLRYSSSSSTFRKAEEKDIPAIHNLSIEIFGPTIAPSYESRLASYLKNPDIYYVAEQDDILVGYLGIAPIKQDIVERIMGETEEIRSRLLTAMSEIVIPENILLFEPGEVDNIYLIAVSRQRLSKKQILRNETYYRCIQYYKEICTTRYYCKKALLCEQNTRRNKPLQKSRFQRSSYTRKPATKISATI